MCVFIVICELWKSDRNLDTWLWKVFDTHEKACSFLESKRFHMTSRIRDHQGDKCIVWRPSDESAKRLCNYADAAFIVRQEVC